MSLLGEVAGGNDRRAVVAALDAVFRLSLGQSLDCVRVGAGSPGAPCVLVLGFGGSSVDDLEPQAQLYSSQGFAVVSLTSCRYPRALAQRQLARLAAALEAALAPGVKLIAHVCSMHGFSFFANIVAAWVSGEPPLERLPPLKEVIAGLVFECVPIPRPEEEGDSRRLSAAELEAWMDRDAEEGVERDPQMVFLVNHTMQALLDRFAPELSWYALTGQHAALRRSVRRLSPVYWSCARRTCAGASWGADMPLFHTYGPFWDFDLSIQPPLPRLFLYSAQDKMFTADAIEESTDLVWKKIRKVKITMERLCKSEHMAQWQTEKRECAKALQDWIKKEKLRRTMCR